MTANTGEFGDLAATRSSLPERKRGDVPADTFAARLVLSRHHAGRLSIEQAAKACGLNSGNWVRWEDGAQPRDKAEVARAIADGLGMDFYWLIEGGFLLPASVRPSKRGRGIPAGIPGWPFWHVNNPIGRPPDDYATQGVRRAREVVRTQPMAA